MSAYQPDQLICLSSGNGHELGDCPIEVVISSWLVLHGPGCFVTSQAPAAHDAGFDNMASGAALDRLFRPCPASLLIDIGMVGERRRSVTGWHDES